MAPIPVFFAPLSFFQKKVEGFLCVAFFFSKDSGRSFSFY
jgi:hypothetical protein